jgi:hypothetical protein
MMAVRGRMSWAVVGNDLDPGAGENATGRLCWEIGFRFYFCGVESLSE